MDWISVHDKYKPEKDQVLLCWYRVKQQPYDTNIGICRYRGEFSFAVNYWKPIPEPPKDSQ